MTNAIDLHSKSRGRTERDILLRVGKAMVGPRSPRVFLNSTRVSERLFTLDLAQTDVATEHVQGLAIMGELDDTALVADLAAPCRYVGQNFGKLQTMNTSTDLSKLKLAPGSADGAAPPRWNPRVITTKFAAREYAYDVSVPPEVMKNADRDLGEALGVFAREVWRLQREYRAATLLSTAGSWGANTVAGANWTSGGNPVADLYKALAISANPRPNLWVLSEKISQYWFDNADVRYFVSTGGLERLGLRVAVGATKTKVGGVLKDVWATGGNNAMLLRTGGANGDGDEVELTTAVSARWDLESRMSSMGEIPRDERWIIADGVLLRTFWDKYTAARGVCAGVLVVDEDVLMVDSTLGAIVTGVTP